MQQITQKSEFSVSFFPRGRWVISGRDQEVVTSQSASEEVQSFFGKNGILPGREKEGFKGAVKLDWLTQMFQPTEHITEAGEILFTDRGNRVTFDRVRVSDDEIRLALVHAQQKFGQQLTLTGDDPVFTERMARLADDMGMTILNPEMQPVISAHRAALACQAPSVAPPLSLKTKRGWWPFSWPNFD